MVKKKPITKYEDLTVKQQRFVDYFDGNATEAARKAGYRNARQMGSENLSKLDILHAIRSRENRRRKGHIADREERQAFWTKVQRGEETQPVVVGTDAGGISIVQDVSPKLADRLRASELLARSEADFVDKVGVGRLTGDEITEIPIIFVKPPKREDDEMDIETKPQQRVFEAKLPPPAGQEQS